jgi:hypothetical protein
MRQRYGKQQKNQSGSTNSHVGDSFEFPDSDLLSTTQSHFRRSRHRALESTHFEESKPKQGAKD